MNKEIYIKVAVKFIFCYLSLLLLESIARPVANWFIQKQWVNWTMFEGYSNTSFCVFLFSIAIYYLFYPKPTVFLRALFLFLIFLFLSVIINSYNEYIRFYVRTDMNGKYSFEIAISNLKNQFLDLFVPRPLTFLAQQFLNILLVLYIPKTLNLRKST